MIKSLENINNWFVNSALSLLQVLIMPIYWVAHFICVLIAAHVNISYFQSDGVEAVTFMSQFVNYGISSSLFLLIFMFILFMIADFNYVEE